MTRKPEHLPHMPKPARARGEQMSYDGWDKAHFDCYDPVQMWEYAEKAISLESEALAMEVVRQIAAVPEERRHSMDFLHHAVEQAIRKRRVARGVGL